MGAQRGQATVEWLAVVLLATLALGALAAAAPTVDGRSLGGLIAHRIACAARGGCADGQAALERAYGPRGAGLVRRHLPGLVFEPGERQLPVDWRRCRSPRCAVAPDDDALDAHRTGAGLRATVFTRLVRRGGRSHVQYWTYYPDSNTTLGGSDRVWRDNPLVRAAGTLLTGSAGYPGYHRDDWEGIAVRVDRDGGVATRVSSHGHWRWCKHALCERMWGPPTGWSRVSSGSHAGHVPVPGRAAGERTSTPDAIRLVPLETLDRRRYRRLDPDVAPPWRKEAYRDPASSAS